MKMDVNALDFSLFLNQSSRGSDIVNIEKTTASEDDRSSLFVNYASIAWHEMRRAWRGDSSQRKHRKPTRPHNSNEELLTSIDHFEGPVPLSKMVEFLVEVWEEDFQD